MFSENIQDAEYARLNRRAFPDGALLQPIDMRVTGVVPEARVRLFGDKRPATLAATRTAPQFMASSLYEACTKFAVH